MTNDRSQDAAVAETTRVEMVPGDSVQEIIDIYKKDVDRTLLIENLKLTVEERLLKAERVMEYVEELRAAGRRARRTG